VLTFSESVTKGTGNLYIVRTSDNVIVETIPVGSTQIVGSGTTWTIDPSITLAAGTSYALRADAKTFVDADGIVFKGIQNNTTLNFATAANAAPVIANLNRQLHRRQHWHAARCQRQCHRHRCRHHPVHRWHRHRVDHQQRCVR
jgi:hypothetical protein